MIFLSCPLGTDIEKQLNYFQIILGSYEVLNNTFRNAILLSTMIHIWKALTTIIFAEIKIETEHTELLHESIIK